MNYYKSCSDNSSTNNLSLSQDDQVVWQVLMQRWDDSTFKAIIIQSLPRLCESIHQVLVRNYSMPTSGRIPKNQLPTPPISPINLKYDSITSFLEDATQRIKVTSSCLALTSYYMALISNLHYQKLSMEEESAISKLIGRGSVQTFIICLLAANKFTEDHPYSNTAWSQISGIPLASINALEHCFLVCLNHRLQVSRAQFKKWVIKLAGRLNWLSTPAPIFAPRPIRLIGRNSSLEFSLQK